MSRWSDYASCFNLSEYRCQVNEFLDDNEEGHIDYMFFSDDVLVAQTTLIVRLSANETVVPFLTVNPNFRGQGIGRKIVNGYLELGRRSGLINTKVYTTALETEGSEPWVSSIGPEINPLDPNDKWFQWCEQYQKDHPNEL